MTKLSTLPTKLQSMILGDILTYHITLYRASTGGELPSAEATEVVATKLNECINTILPVLQPAANPLPAKDRDDHLSSMWHQMCVRRAQGFGLSEATANQLVDHLHNQSDLTTPL